MKKITVPVAIFVGILGLVLAVVANMGASRMQNDYTQENYKRILAEKELQDAQRKIKMLQAQLSEAQTKIERIEGILNTGKADKQELQDQLKDTQKQLEILKKERDVLKQQPVPSPEGPGSQP